MTGEVKNPEAAMYLDGQHCPVFHRPKVSVNDECGRILPPVL
jgi:hypothetical protein